MSFRSGKTEARRFMGWRFFLLFTASLTILFAGSLFSLARLSFSDNLASHTPLIPFVSAYLLWLRKDSLTANVGGVRWPGLALGLAGIVLMAVSWKPNTSVGAGDLISAHVLAFYLLLSGGGFFLLGSRVMRGAAFPFLFLLFMIPPPAKVMEIAEIGLQYASAETAIRFIKLTGTPVYREGLVFVMPRLAIEVARECSGIRSSLVLFITSLVAGNVLLSHWWTRLILALIVIPLGIVRNAIRVLVISMLSVHVDASYIHSPIHRQGGPIFFALSLVPFAIILYWLKRIESRNIRGT